jgi:hypothetical protein
MWAEVLCRAFKSRSGTIRAWFPTLLPLLCLLPIVSFSGCDHASQPNQGSWTISGQAYLLGSADPLPGVKIACAGMSTTSGADGSYEFRGVPEGTQTITAQKENCDDYSYSIEINADRKFYIYLHLKTAKVWGHVANAIDGPIQGAKVQVSDFVDYTDADGRYELSNVPQSTDTLFVTHPDYNTFKIAVSPDSSERQVDVVLTTDRIIEGAIREDTYVYEALPNANYDASAYLYLSTNNSSTTNQRRNIYMKFEFPELLKDERVTVFEAKLELAMIFQAAQANFQIYAVASSWTASSLRFSTQPALGALLASGVVGGGLAGTYYTVLGTDGLTRMLQDWRANRPVYGITIQGGPTWPGSMAFYSIDWIPYQPMLTFKVRY